MGRAGAERAGGSEDQRRGRAERVLGAGGAGHPGRGEFLPGGRGGQRGAGARVSAAQGQAGRGRRQHGEVLLRRQRGHQREDGGGGLVLQAAGSEEDRGWADSDRAAGDAHGEVRGGRSAVRQREPARDGGDGLLRAREIPVCAGQAVSGRRQPGGLRVSGHLQGSAAVY